MDNDLVYIDEYSLLGSNFYWYRYETYGLTKEDVLSVGLTGPRVQVSKEIIALLVEIDKVFQEKLGYRLYVKEGYRSKELYNLLYKIRCQNFGQAETDKLLNMKDMPHSLGKTVDVALWDTKTDSEVFMRDKSDGTDSFFIDFYKNRSDEKSQHYQKLQETVREIMESYGFTLGTKKEYFHFDFKKPSIDNF